MAPNERTVDKDESNRQSRPAGSARPGGLKVQPAAPHQNEPTGLQNLRLNLQRELQLARQMRLAAEVYRRQTEMKARSEAQRLILETRLSVKRGLAKLESEASEEVKKLLVDIRIIRLAAQEELEAQRQFTSAARISALATGASQDKVKPTQKSKQPVRKNSSH